MTNPFVQAHDNIKAQIEIARQVEREKLKPVLAEVFTKVPWLYSLSFDTEQRYNDEDYYTPCLAEVGFQLSFIDGREYEMNLDGIYWYDGELDVDRDDVDALWEDYGLTIDELDQFESAFKDLFYDVSGDVVDQVFGADTNWNFDCDGDILTKEQYHIKVFGVDNDGK